MILERPAYTERSQLRFGIICSSRTRPPRRKPALQFGNSCVPRKVRNNVRFAFANKARNSSWPRVPWPLFNFVLSCSCRLLPFPFCPFFHLVVFSISVPISPCVVCCLPMNPSDVNAEVCSFIFSLSLFTSYKTRTHHQMAPSV